MNPNNMTVARPSVPSGEAMQRLAHWLRRNSHEDQTRGHNRRQQMAERYPVGLLTDDELDALLAATCR